MKGLQSWIDSDDGHRQRLILADDDEPVLIETLFELYIFVTGKHRYGRIHRHRAVAKWHNVEVADRAANCHADGVVQPDRQVVDALDLSLARSAIVGARFNAHRLQRRIISKAGMAFYCSGIESDRAAQHLLVGRRRAVVQRLDRQRLEMVEPGERCGRCPFVG